MIHIALLVLIIVGIIGTYNSLISQKNQVTNTLSGIDVQLKKRYDLIPNLVESVKGYMKHEETVLARLVELRNTPYSQLNEKQKEELDWGLQKMVGGIRMTMEQYPDLNASENMMHLQRTLNETEEQLSAARRSYNAAVMSFNTAVESFPTNLIAKMMHLQPQQSYEARQEERENVHVQF